MTYKAIFKILFVVLVLLIAVILLTTSQAQDSVGVHQGRYSPAFDLLMRQQDQGKAENCVVPTHSAPLCKDGGFDPGTVKNLPMNGSNKECTYGEFVAINKEGKQCRLRGYCYCGKQT